MCNMYSILQSLCAERGITITEMCREAEVPRSSVGNLATGNTQQLSARNMQKLAQYFGVSTDYLLGAKEPAEAAGGGPEDEFVGFYGEVKADLTQDDLDDIKKLMAIRAELNRSKGK